MLHSNFQKRFTELPDELKIEALNFIEFLHYKADKNFQTIEVSHFENSPKKNIVNNNEPLKKISAKQLLTFPKSERNAILKAQATQAKIMYQQNPDLLLPDLIEDLIEA
ncbi:MAG: hypothetical protein HW421_157 [Ignavibacteria bacterium]|nr:hypothetical protein [Ignavibacteria bacterium]